MPDYGEILAFLAANPPHLDTERELHASLLELLAQCLRSDQAIDAPFSELPIGEDEDDAEAVLQALANCHARWGRLH